MSFYDILFGRAGLASLVVLAGGVGATLVLSMPWAGRVADFFSFPWRPTPLAFLISILGLGAVHAMVRGGAVEHLARLQRRQLAWLPVQVLVAQTLIVPYVVTASVLTPASRVGILWEAWAYILIVDAALAIWAFHLSRLCLRRRIGALLPLLGFGVLVSGVPLAVGLPFSSLRSVALLSPPYAVFRLAIAGLSAPEFLLAYLTPGALAALGFIAGLRRVGRDLYA